MLYNSMYWFSRNRDASSKASSMPHEPSYSRSAWVTSTRCSLAWSMVRSMEILLQVAKNASLRTGGRKAEGSARQCQRGLRGGDGQLIEQAPEVGIDQQCRPMPGPLEAFIDDVVQEFDQP